MSGSSAGFTSEFIGKFELPTTTAGPSDSNGDVVAVGLSDPSIARNRKEMLELVNRLRDTGYVVHASQSSFTVMNSTYLQRSNRY